MKFRAGRSPHSRRKLGDEIVSPTFPPQVFVRLAVAIAGVGLLVAGGIAVFVTDNGTGSAALVSLGAALLLAAGLWDRLESFEFAGAKMQMRVVERLRDRAG